jgi:hypothetical protein
MKWMGTKKMAYNQHLRTKKRKKNKPKKLKKLLMKQNQQPNPQFLKNWLQKIHTEKSLKVKVQMHKQMKI